MATHDWNYMRIVSNHQVKPNKRKSDGPKILIIHAHGFHDGKKTTTVPEAPEFIFAEKHGRQADQDELESKVINGRKWKFGYPESGKIADYYLHKYRSDKNDRSKDVIDEVEGWMKGRNDFDVLIPRNRNRVITRNQVKFGKEYKGEAVKFSSVIKLIGECNYSLIYCSFCRVNIFNPFG